MKSFLYRIPYFKNLRDKNYLSKNTRRNLMIYYFYKYVFGLNREFKIPINFTSIAISPENIEIGENSHISFLVSANCYFQAINGIKIGRNCIFAPCVQFISANHDIENDSHVDAPPIVIGNNCWIGTNVVILPGVELGDNTIVAAGSVVTKSFIDGNVIIKGVPAK